jgi:hypothetical protein
LRQILRALQERRENKGADTVALSSMSRVTINLTDYSINVHSELASALKEINPPDKIHLIRECQTCPRLFWAGRVDKVACDKHAGKLRKSKQRKKEKEDRAKAEKEASDRKIRNQLKRMSRTAVALLNAIVFKGERVYWKIDTAAYWELKDNNLVLRAPNYRIVRQTLTMLVDRGYLRHEPQGDPAEDYYLPQRKLLNHWSEIRREQS